MSTIAKVTVLLLLPQAKYTIRREAWGSERGQMMAGITKIVDDQIKALRKERAELDALKAELDMRQTELTQQESSWENGSISHLEEKNAALQKEVEDAVEALARLRAERSQSIDSFGSEIDQIHSKLASENEAALEQLQKDILSLNKTKTDMEGQIERLTGEIADMEKQKEADITRIRDEKEQYLMHQRTERENSLKALNMEHSMEAAALEQKISALEGQLASLEQQKDLEWEKVHAEVARYKTGEEAEAEAKKEHLLAEAEALRAEILKETREIKSRRIAEFSEIEKNHEREISSLELRKQSVQDDIELLKYEYEKIKAENVVKLEKSKVDELRSLEYIRAEALEKIEAEKRQLSNELEQRKIDTLKRMQEERGVHEKELAEFERKKTGLQNDISLLYTKFDRLKADNEADLEGLKSEKLREIDESRLQKLQAVEDMRQARMAELEKMYFSRIESLQAERDEKLEEIRKAIDEAEQGLAALKLKRQRINEELETAISDSNRIKAENEALLKRAVIDRQTELEKMEAQKMGEIEAICTHKLKNAEDVAGRIYQNSKEEDLAYRTQLDTLREEVREMERQRDSLSATISQLSNEQLSLLEEEKINEMEKISKLKLSKLQEIEAYLEKYREDRLKHIQDDFERQMSANRRSLEELTALNDDYDKRARGLEELALILESDKRAVELKESLITKEQSDYKELIQSGLEFQRKELSLLIEAKDQQIALLEDRIKTYLAGMAEKAKAYDYLEQENRQLALQLSEPSTC